MSTPSSPKHRSRHKWRHRDASSSWDRLSLADRSRHPHHHGTGCGARRIRWCRSTRASGASRACTASTGSSSARGCSPGTTHPKRRQRYVMPRPGACGLSFPRGGEVHHHTIDRESHQRPPGSRPLREAGDTTALGDPTAPATVTAIRSSRNHGCGQGVGRARHEPHAPTTIRKSSCD